MMAKILEITFKNQYFKITIYTFFLFFIFDYIFGIKVLDIILLNDREHVEKKYRVYDKRFSHTLKSNFSGIGWWDKKYKICTNHLGAKFSCEKNLNIKNFDIVFIGDSNTEGVGLNWEQTFVGKIEKKLKNKRILNMGVAGYTTDHYLSKVDYFLKKNISFKELIVFIDPSDIYDQHAWNLNVKKDGYYVTSNKESEIKIFLKNYLSKLPITYRIIIGFRRIIGNLRYKQNIQLSDHLSKDFNLTHWTFEGSNESLVRKLPYKPMIENAKSNMNNLYKILKSKNISLSIVTYPHPAQIYNDNLNSKNERIWMEFCIRKCKEFINISSMILNEAKYKSKQKIIDDFYIKKDVHFNETGASFIAKSFLQAYKLNN